MPFDGQPTDYAVKPDVFSVTGLRDWLITQDGAIEYDFVTDEGECLLDRYVRAVKHLTTKRCHEFTAQMPKAAYSVAAALPRTYAAALDRCNALIKEGAA